MATTFGDIYRDITSRLADVGIAEQDFYRKDLVNAINDAVREVQAQFVKQGGADDFLVSETLTPTTQDVNYPFLYSTTLAQPIMEEFPIARVVYNSVVTTVDPIVDGVDTFEAGDFARKDGKLYKAVTAGSSVDAYDLTFKPDNIKNYYNNNGLKFEAGDIAYNQSDGTYWKATTSYTNDQGQSISTSGAFEQVYWMEVGDAFAEGFPLDFDALFRAKLQDKLHQSYPFTIRQDTLYVGTPNVDYHISYVPEWTDVEDFSADMDIPETAIPSIKDMAMQKLAMKIQVEFQTQNDGDQK